MGNSQFRDAERTCGKFPAPIAHKRKQNIAESFRTTEKDLTLTAESTVVRVSSATTATSATTNSTHNAGAAKESPGGVLTVISSTIKGILDPPEPERLPPRRHAPKKMLYGCETVDEHFVYIQDICARVSNLKSKEGLDAMRFEYRMVHHRENCSCPDAPVDSSNLELTDSDENDGYCSDLSKDEDDEYGQFEQPTFLENEAALSLSARERCFGATSSNDDNRVTLSDSLKQSIAGKNPAQENDSDEPIMVPIGIPIREHDSRRGGNSVVSASTNALSRSSSAVSMFSLVTHNTEEYSNAAGSKQSQQQRRNNSGRFPLSSIAGQPSSHVIEQDACALRLHHIPSGTMVTNENYLEFVADGEMYDQLARLCMEYTQEIMMEEGDLEWRTICDKRTFGALVSKSYPGNNTSDIAAATTKKKRKTLLVVTGKGQVTAGIFSRRHLLVTSMESACALPFIREAKKRDMDIVMLDPNALGSQFGLDVVEASLMKLFLENGRQDTGDEEEDIYILAHSMAGAQIVRFFMNNASSYSRPAAPSSGSNNCTADSTSGRNTARSTCLGGSKDESAREALMQRVQAIALTDSNHNINWTKKSPAVMEFFTGPRSLYIKSHKVHEKAKKLGEVHHDCQFWKHRFGNIKTLWAGTHEHALTNYTGRFPIWEHFDSFLNKESVTDGATAQ